MMNDEKRNEDTLKDVYAELSSGLEVIVSYAGNLFSADKNTIKRTVIETLSDSIEQLALFESFAIYGLADQFDFELWHCSSTDATEEFNKDVDGHIEHGTFAWALKNAKAVIVTEPHSHREQVLFALATRRRVHGMFIGNARQGKNLSGYMQNLLRLSITLAAQSIDNIELTSQIKRHNQNLEQKIAQRTRELEIAKQKAEDSARSKAAFLANMSHEIRTPMNGVLGMLELLDKSSLSDKQKQLVGTAHRSGNNLLVILNDILDLSKFEAGKISLDETDFDLRALINDVVELFAPRTQEKGLEIAGWVDESVPEYIIADRTRLWQVISNLIGNAVKFTATGFIGIQVKCTRTNKDNDLQLQFEIQDTGIGLDEIAMQKIFEPFEQADTSTTRDFGGTGLGLALCEKLSGLMGGSICVNSEPGKGSKFLFTVSAVASMKKPEQKVHGVNLSGTTSGLRALVVDDLIYTRKSIEGLLSRRGVEVVTADSGVEAQQLLEQSLENNRPYDLLLVDDDMPGLSGNELLAELRKDERYSELKFWVMSVQAETVDGDNSRTADIEGLIKKPVLPTYVDDILLNGCTDSASKSDLREEENKLPILGAEVLLVEDNMVNQMVAEGLLNLFGLNVTIAENGVEALETLERKDFDLIFMDVLMPVMNGLDATQEIRQIENGSRHVPIIALTASVLKEDVDNCYESGMDDFLAKPFDSDGLREKLEKWLIPVTDNPDSKDRTG